MDWSELLVPATLPTEITLLSAAFIFCSLIGIERQMRQKSAGFRTHVLVGCGSAVFTLVSSFGFSAVIGGDILLDPSRISAQIVSGIGFLGAGVIFTRRNIVVGLTTAATIWVTAAVGMACGAGMIGLAASMTFLHLLTLVILAPVVRKLPDPDRNRVVSILYTDGFGLLRQILTTATHLGFEASILSTHREEQGGKGVITVHVRFRGRPPLRDLLPALVEIDGVREVTQGSLDDDGGD